MYSYPTEYLIQPIPILAVYGLNEIIEKNSAKKLDSPIPAEQSLPTSLLELLTHPVDYDVYKVTKHLDDPKTPPPFKVISVSNDYTVPLKRSPSHLSPLEKDSPLYPDGFMTPLWVKKHLSSPSVIVGFYELWQNNAPRETGPLASQLFIDPAEREKDISLYTEINSKRKYFQDKGIKYAVVIIIKEQTYDHSIEDRLSVIKRHSGLDHRSAFFSIAPENDLKEFINNLNRALFEPSLQFYNNRIKKVRKKKSKVSTIPRDTESLSITGWFLHYDLKIAYFQETKQDIEGALRTFESIYGNLSDMLVNDTLILYGQRWKEARVMLDCIHIKLCKYHLYLKDPTSTISQLDNHLRLFQSNSSHWGTGDRTFEYWAWLSRQYRDFAQIIETATQSGYQIPLPADYLNPNPLATLEVTGLNPSAILQHAGFYYHLAAMCFGERRRRFLSNPTHSKQEAKLDHATKIVELLTKSYEQFKKFKNTRMTLYLAAEIAGTYYESGKFEMALKFFDRIGKTYRKERWQMVLTSILRWSLRCARELGWIEKRIECLVELMSDQLPVSKRLEVQKEWDEILKTPGEVRSCVVQMSQLNAFVSCSALISQRSSDVGSRVLYQVVLVSDSESPPVPFRFSRLRVMFSEEGHEGMVEDDGSQVPLRSVEFYDGSVEEGPHKFNLEFQKSQMKVFQGFVVPKECGELKITNVCLDIITPYWNIELNYNMDQLSHDLDRSKTKWLESYIDNKPTFKILSGQAQFNTTNIIQKPPITSLKFDRAAPALIDELFKMDIVMTNSEVRPVEASLTIDMKHSEGQIDEDYVLLSIDDPERSSTRETTVGWIEPGESITTSLYLHGGISTGSRLIQYTVRFKTISQTTEKIGSVRIPFICPFDVKFELCSQSRQLGSNALMSLDRSERWLLLASIRCFSVWELNIKSVELEKDNSFSSPHTSLTLISKMDDFNGQVWKIGHVYNVNYLFQLATDDITEKQVPVPAGNILIDWKRADDESDTSYKSIIRLPSLEFQLKDLVVLADIPCDICLGEAFTITYTVYNPTPHLKEYQGSMELSEAFVFSGYKQLTGRVLPYSRKPYHYICHPLSAGKVKLPKLKLTVSGLEKEVQVETAGSLIFILNSELERKQIETESDSIFVHVHPKRRF